MSHQVLMFVGAGGAILFGVVLLTFLVNLRVVVPTNYVHIIQSSSHRISYGQGSKSGNTYYKWPPSIPVVGVMRTVLPVSVFDLPLNNYDAYDKGRVPFMLDVIAFFRIDDPSMAAERVSNFDELKSQLINIVKGAVRTILAKADIEEILENRGVYGEQFTTEVLGQLKEWGVVPVKNIELMDIRDAKDSLVITSIMAKKSSLINAQSRQEVAKNGQAAQTAEIEAQRQVQLAQQEAAEQVGIRTAQKDQNIGINKQKAEQAIAVEAATTAQKGVDVDMVTQVGQANIDKNAKIVAAERDRSIRVINAEAEKQVAVTQAEGTQQQTALVADGALQGALKEAQGIKAKGEANGAAALAMQMAPVSAQIALADKIGGDAGYQSYLVTVRNIEALQAIGVEQAKALEHADVKVFATSGNPVDGATSVMDLFGPKGGLRLGAFLEGLKSTTAGKDAVDAATHAVNGKDDPKSWNGARA